MKDPNAISSNAGDRPEPATHAGWAVLVGVLGIVFLMIGFVLIGMLQAPVVRPGVVVTGFVLIACGLLLLPVAWLNRKPGGRSSKD